MVKSGIPESDWKAFRKLRDVALERLEMDMSQVPKGA
jgi:hypothetical protein